MPLRIFVVYENSSIPHENFMDGAHPTKGVQTRSRGIASDCPSRVLMVPTNLSSASNTPA